MPRSTGQKLKPLLLQRLLLEETDEDHPLPMEHLLMALEQHSITAERKSIYSDIEALRDMGVDVQYRSGKNSGWFVGQREFQLTELKLLVDAVQACPFITQRKSDELIDKLTHLTSIHQARQFQRQVYPQRRVKTLNESVYYTIDKLHTALAAGDAISFRYFEYSIRKERIYRRAGRRYTVHPHGLILESEHYYLIGWDVEINQVRHYRVDKISDLIITGQSCVEEPFHMATYAGKHFGMFSGREGQIRLRIQNGLVGVVLDRFGQDVTLAPAGGGYFTITIDAVVCPQFFGWLFGMGDQIQLLSPDWAIKAFKLHLSAVRAQYASLHKAHGRGTLWRDTPTRRMRRGRAQQT